MGWGSAPAPRGWAWAPQGWGTTGASAGMGLGASGTAADHRVTRTLSGDSRTCAPAGSRRADPPATRNDCPASLQLAGPVQIALAILLGQRPLEAAATEVDAQHVLDGPAAGTAVGHEELRRPVPFALAHARLARAQGRSPRDDQPRLHGVLPIGGRPRQGQHLPRLAPHRQVGRGVVRVRWRRDHRLHSHAPQQPVGRAAHQVPQAMPRDHRRDARVPVQPVQAEQPLNHAHPPGRQVAHHRRAGVFDLCEGVTVAGALNPQPLLRVGLHEHRARAGHVNDAPRARCSPSRTARRRGGRAVACIVVGSSRWRAPW